MALHKDEALKTRYSGTMQQAHDRRHSLCLELVGGDDVGDGHHLVLVDRVEVLGDVLREEETG